jgi:hypothetical protein
MRRNIIVATITAIIVSLGITYQITATTSHEIKDETPAATAETRTESQPQGTTTPNLAATPPPPPPQQNQEPPAQNRLGETSDHTGKPGEVKP